MLNVSKPIAYCILAISVTLEIIGSACLEACNGFEDKKLTIVVIICYLVAFTLFAKILHIIDIAIGYATWSSLASIAIAVIGVIFFKQHLTIVGWLSLVAMSFGVFMLNLYGSAEENEPK